jgi:small conductance mechanosensitive channel
VPGEEAFKTLWALAATSALSVVGGIAILILGWLVASWAGRTTEKLLGRVPRMDALLAGFLSSVVRYGLLALVGIAVLNQFGVQTASIIAVLGATGLAIGLALQGTLSNLAAGAMLLLFRPFTVGDLVQLGGHRGWVRELNLFTTHLDSIDNVRVILPNSKVWGDIILNLSVNPRLRIAVNFVVTWAQELGQARDLMLQAAAAAPGIHSQPPPTATVVSADAAGVTLRIEAWTDARDQERAVVALGWAIAGALAEFRRSQAAA